jgi:hypothetical protein
MANIKVEYGTTTQLTVTGVASLASSSSLLAGYETSIIDNTSLKVIDFILDGAIKAGTTPTVGLIEVHVVGVQGDDTWPDVFDGTASAETITSAGIKQAICKQAVAIVNETTTDRIYPFGPVSIKSLFGDVLPRKAVAFLTHSTVAALNASGHVMNITPVYYTST